VPSLSTSADSTEAKTIKYIYGAYGTGNLGDDLLLKAALEYHRSLSNDTTLRVVAYGAPFLEEENLEVIDHDEFIKNPENHLSATSSLHFSGGGLFWAASHCDDMLKVAIKQKELGGEVHIERIGTQGFHKNPDSVKALFSLADSNTVRDKMSADLLARYGVYEAANASVDYVLTLDRSAYPQQRSERPIVAINHSATTFYRDPDHRTKTLRIYKQLAQHFKGEVDFVHFPHTRHFRCIDQNDIINGEQFWCSSGGMIKALPFPATAEDALRTFSTFAGVIGWRYHLLVLAKLFDVPSAYLGQPGEHKYGAFAQENLIPMINFDLDESTILRSCKRFVSRDILKRPLN
jgi:polysaccharide pyruvyl transferase WcaK-like protein